MKKLLLLLFTLFTTIGTWAEDYCFLTTKTEVTSITSGKYYVIDGRDQVGSTAHYLFDNGTKVTSNNPQALPTDPAEAGKFVWQIVGNSTDGWTLQNLATGKYMSLGSSNGSQISSSTTPQTNGIYFAVVGEDTYATILNSNGQAIDIGAWGSNPTTWGGSTTPAGSRRLKIYEVEPVVITDDACYTMTFHAKTSGNTWGLKSGTTEQAPVASGTGDVFVAHSYTNASGNKRWIFVNNSNGTYLAYHGLATSNFDITNAINEWNIQTLTAGSGNVSADAPVAGKLCITNDKRYTNNTSKGCYIVQESNGTYNNSDAPYLDGSYTSALEFTATGDAVSAAATLAIAKFDALYQVKDVVACASNMSALFADPGTLIADINAAATAEAANTIATNYMKSAEGKKFYANPSTATSYFVNFGTSQITATDTELTAESVMELEYAGKGKYYLKGTKCGYYAGNPLSGGANPGTVSSKGSATALYVGNYANTVDNVVYFARTKTGGYIEAIHYNSGYTAAGSVVAWTYNAGASQWNITHISDEAYDILANVSAVTFNVILEANGAVKATTTKDIRKGHALVIPSEIAKDYCTYTYYSDAACTAEISVVPDAATTTVYALASYTMPFTVSSDFASATWYYATLRGKYLRADDDHKDDSGRYQTNSTNEHTDAYKWAFFGGNPYDGFYVMNKNQGSSKYLYKETQLVFKSGITPTEDNNALFAVTPNSNGGFTLRNIAGGSTWYINDAGNGGNLGFWNSASGANDGGSNWVITEAPDVEINVTYDLYVGGEKVDTYVDEYVAGNSDVNIPSSWTNNYIAYDLATSGTIGTTDCTITVTATLKSSTKTPAELSNTKKYRLVSVRGGLSTYTDETGETPITYLASPCKTSLGVSAKEFAILSYGGRNYLYSVSDEKFVIFDGADNTKAKVRDNVTGTADAITFTATSNYRYAITFNNETSKYLNSSPNYDYGVVINSWGGDGYWDDGNQYVIEEVDDFDSETALSALTTFIDGQTTLYNGIITDLEAINWSDEHKAGQLNRYNFIGDFVDYAGNESSIISGLKSIGYTSENLQVVQNMNNKGSGYALNLPVTGKFYRIKGYSGNYITSNTASSNASMNGTASANNIVYYSADKNLIFFGSGYGLYNTSIVAPAGSTLNTYTFSEGAQESHYYIKSNATGVGTYCYDNTSNGTKLDRNGSPVTSGSYQTDWTLEEITSLPLSIAAGSYASFSAPVAVTIPDDCYAYIATGEETDVVNMTKVTGDVAANTGLIISTVGIDVTGPLSFDIVESGTEYASNLLVANVAAANVSTTNNYFFGQVSGNYVFTLLSGDTYTLPGHKAYLHLEGETNEGARLSINWGGDDSTGLSELSNEVIKLNDGKYYQNGTVIVVRNGVKYNVAGQTIK